MNTSSQRILVIALQQLGDVLLATALLNRIKRKHPNAVLEILVFADTAPILQGNPDIARVLTVQRRFERESNQTHVQFVRSLWRRWDIAIVALPSDRSHIYALSAAPVRLGYVHTMPSKHWWQKISLKRWRVFPENVHRVHTFSALADLLNDAGSSNSTESAPALGLLTPPQAPVSEIEIERPYVVLHASPRVAYKRWHTQRWQELAQYLHSHSMQVVVSGSADIQEKNYNDQVFGECDFVIRKDGQYSLAQWSAVFKQAACFIGVDTSTTHIAAASGTPTVAIFGPTDPTIWGPLPNDSSAGSALPSHYQPAALIQIHSTVALVQNPTHRCVPCQQEGCDKHRQSHAACLDDMPLSSILHALRALGITKN